MPLSYSEKTKILDSYNQLTKNMLSQIKQRTIYLGARQKEKLLYVI